jgi:uracil-DNA glycosylase
MRKELPKGVHESWTDIMLPLLQDKRYSETQDMILGLVRSKTKVITPEPANIYRVFRKPVEHYSIYVFAEAPYWTISKTPDSTTRTAIGRAFAIPYAKGEEGLSPSLKVIIEALRVQYSHPALHYHQDVPFDVTLEHWENQGVMLLNRYLTAELRNSNSIVHSKYWSWFTEGLIKNISDQTNAKIFHLWGQKAKQLSTLIDTEKHYIIEASHPQATNYNTAFDFPNEDIFLKTDEITKHLNNEVIKWF